MLNRALLLRELEAASASLFLDTGHEYEIARASWQRIIADALFTYKIKEVTTDWLIPVWQEPLHQVYPIAQHKEPYAVLAIDGSQIYPDKHQGTSCFLINIGTVELHYNTGQKPVYLNSVPTVFPCADAQDDEDEKFPISPDIVNCRRQEFEFKAALEQGIALKRQLAGVFPFIFLFDGSLIFWHLESKEQALRDHFISCYIMQLHQLYEQRILCAGYISLPKNKELINLIRIELCNFVLEGCTQLSAVEHLVDTTVANFFLQPGQRSIVFRSNAKIGKYYPEHLKPHFLYMHVGHEIVRLEIPGWIAQDVALVDQVCALAFDQSTKGNGYPISIAEAHEQAVIKGPDREFFYHLISRMGMQQKQRVLISQKTLKKRGIGI